MAAVSKAVRKVPGDGEASFWLTMLSGRQLAEPLHPPVLETVPWQRQLIPVLHTSVTYVQLAPTPSLHEAAARPQSRRSRSIKKEFSFCTSIGESILTLIVGPAPMVLMDVGHGHRLQTLAS